MSFSVSVVGVYEGLPSELSRVGADIRVRGGVTSLMIAHSAVQRNPVH